jgi:hypothetical protein
MDGVSKQDIHRRILTQLGSSVLCCGEINTVPFKLQIKNIGSLAFYAFSLLESRTLTRPESEYRIQLVVPGQKRTEKGNFAFIANSFSILLGWSPENDVFILWDAYAHKAFSYNQNIQVKREIVWLAKSRGIATCERNLKNGNGREIVVACLTECIEEAVYQRIKFSALRLEYRKK